MIDEDEAEATYIGYLASALTNLTQPEWRELREIRSVIEDACAEARINLYVPEEHTHPDEHATIPAPVVFDTDRRAVTSADVLILVAAKPSFGAGQELEIARNALIPIIAIHKGGEQLSRMVHGSPTFKRVIDYKTHGYLRERLSYELKMVTPLFADARASRLQVRRQLLGSNIKNARTRARLSERELAARVGIASAEIEAIEGNYIDTANPSAILLSRIAHALDTNLATLCNPSIPSHLIQLSMQMRTPDEYLAGARKRRPLTERDRTAIRRRVEASLHRMVGT